MADLTTGRIPKAIGPTQVGDSLITDNGAGGISVAGPLVLAGATSGGVTLRVPAAAGASTITWPVGTTDFTATGGVGRVLKQVAAGAPITVAAVTPADMGALGAGVGAWLGTPTSANLAAAVSDETGTGALVFANTPTLVTPILGAATGTSVVVSGLLQAGTTLGISTDVLLNRTGANSLALRNGTNAQAFRSYNTWTDASNGEWAYVGDWSASVARYGTDKNGTGVARATQFLSGGAIAGNIDASAQWVFGSTNAGNALINIIGTYTTANAQSVNIAGTFASSQTGTQQIIAISTTLAPAGASLSQFSGLLCSPTLNSTAFAINNAYAFYADIAFGASFTGTVGNVYGYAVADITANTPGQLALVRQFGARVLSNGNGLTTGTITNRQFAAAGITAGAAGGTLANRGIEIIMPSGGASSGTTTNYGLYITGNGGTASGGTVTNYALFSDSTTLSLMQSLRIGGTTGAANPTATVAGTPFMYLTSCAGTPTGAPRDAAVGSIAIQWDTTAKKLWVYDQPSATWKGVVLA